MAKEKILRETKCVKCGVKIYFNPMQAPRKDEFKMCGQCALDELEKAGAVAHTVREGKVIETYHDPGMEQLIKTIRLMVEKEKV